MTGPVIQLDQFTSLLTEVEAEPRLVRLCHSRMLFVRTYPREAQEIFLFQLPVLGRRSPARRRQWRNCS
jgi:hypothetical protein